jgi:hypothetical protein
VLADYKASSAAVAAGHGAGHHHEHTHGGGGHEHAHDDKTTPKSSKQKATKKGGLPPKTAGVRRIGLLVPTISAKIKAVTHLSLFRVFMPTLLKSIGKGTAKSAGFEYVIYLGYDVGDALYDTKAGMRRVRARFRKMTKGYPVHLMPSAHSGAKGAPCWIWNTLADFAYHDDADFLYQLNDDISFETAGWAKILTAALDKSPAHRGFGVTGPVDTNNESVFTQSFVSRLHLEIFDTYYPVPFKNWWSDDWISKVYDKKFRFTNRAVRVRNTNRDGTRYKVSYEAKKFLEPQLVLGRALVKKYLAKKH